MLEPKTVSIKSQVLTADKVSTQKVEVEIKNWSSMLLELFRSSIMYEMPTKHFDEIEIRSNDKMLITEAIEIRMKALQLPRNAKISDISIKVKHDNVKIDNPINISTSIFKLGLNEKNLCVLGRGKSMEISAIISERSYNERAESWFTFGYQFIRKNLKVHNENGKNFNECQYMDVEYNSGKIIIICPDTLSEKEFLPKFLELVTSKTNKIRSDYDDIYEFRLGKGILKLTGRFSIKIAEMFCVMVADEHGFDILPVPKIIGGKNLMLEINGVEEKKMKKFVFEILDKIDEIVNLAQI